MKNSKDKYEDIRDGIRGLFAEFPDEYFLKLDDERAYPEAFVDALTKAGWMAALIPEESGGSGLGLSEASVVMEEINRQGGNSGDCHGQMYNMNTLLRHGSDAQKKLWRACCLSPAVFRAAPWRGTWPRTPRATRSSTCAAPRTWARS